MQMWKVTTSEIISRAFLTESSTPWAMATPMLDPALAGLTCKHTNVKHDSIFKILACNIHRKSILTTTFPVSLSNSLLSNHFASLDLSAWFSWSHLSQIKVSDTTSSRPTKNRWPVQPSKPNSKAKKLVQVLHHLVRWISKSWIL